MGEGGAQCDAQLGRGPFIRLGGVRIDGETEVRTLLAAVFGHSVVSCCVTDSRLMVHLNRKRLHGI